ncbi:hypothetical protein B296_00046980 [Ensete ventricosum]|uniref:Uncharacterized protein n=1 Tax=Ensete ventricosum TaxID=4639 RepID=A0A426Z1M9_ENSVE|nr:hypothetical protein B296_00046980 [Ensete ventricosum]
MLHTSSYIRLPSLGYRNPSKTLTLQIRVLCVRLHPSICLVSFSFLFFSPYSR